MASRRRIDAALLVDKPRGMTSNAALQRVKRLLRAEKAGHGGTLDPLASGLLPILFGEATKFGAFLLDADKEYLATVKLGERTATGDAEGPVVAHGPAAFEDAAVERALASLRGAIFQTPPMYSALKRGGRPLYELARAGARIELERRPVTIHRLELLGRRGEQLDLQIRCSKGTYIRVLAEDLGKALGTEAHLAQLRRTASGAFRVEQAVTLADMEAMDEAARNRCLLPLERLLDRLPRAELGEDAARRFRSGQTVRLGGLGAGPCAVYAERGGLIGIGQASSAAELRPLRLTAAPQPAEKAK